MHKITVKYYKWNTYIEEGYRVALYCDEVYNSRQIALFQDGDDAIRCANEKALELGLEVKVWESAKEKMKEIRRRDKKSEKKRRDKKK